MRLEFLKGTVDCSETLDKSINYAITTNGERVKDAVISTGEFFYPDRTSIYGLTNKTESDVRCVIRNCQKCESPGGRFAGIGNQVQCKQSVVVIR